MQDFQSRCVSLRLRLSHQLVSKLSERFKFSSLVRDNLLLTTDITTPAVNGGNMYGVPVTAAFPHAVRSVTAVLKHWRLFRF